MPSEIRPNILFIMCDQLRYDAIAAQGLRLLRTPNFDRLLQRSVQCTNAYSTCPVCVPARMTIRTGCEPSKTGIYENERAVPMDGQAASMRERCGNYLAEVLRDAGYRTFGVGKFHHIDGRRDDIGYDQQLFAEELMLGNTDDDYSRFIRREHPEYSHIEQQNGERTEMYYMPQTSPFPAELTSETYVTDRVLEFMAQDDGRPFFGYCSFVGPHPPCAPPIPFNRMYNPDILENPVRGDRDTDLLDEQIIWMNHAIWADEINDFGARGLKARYYGEVSYIDSCLGRLLDAVDRRPDADNTMIVFCSDHGDHLGDHHAWQKESYFEQSTHIPMLISWPARLAPAQDSALLCHADLFGLFTSAAGVPDLRDGIDLYTHLLDHAPTREYLFACYGRPGTPRFKCMIRRGAWKYIYMSNGGREQLFQLDWDPRELCNRMELNPEIAAEMRAIAAAHCERDGLRAAVCDGKLIAHPYTPRPLERIHQFGIPENDFTVSKNR